MSISVTTREGSAASTKFSISETAGNVTVEFSRNSRFSPIVLTKTVTPVARKVTLSLSASEVDLVGQGHFRVKSGTRIIEDGITNYVPSSKPAADLATQSAIARAPRGVPGREYGMVLGALRNDGAAGGYWQPISDGAHRPSFIDSVVTDSQKITIYYNSLGAHGKIGTLLATTDETLAQNGFFVGSSVSSVSAELKLSQVPRPAADHISWSGSAWVSADGVFQSSWSAGVLTLTHPTVKVAPEDRLNVSVVARAGATAAYSAMISAAGSAVDATTVKIEFRDFAGNLVTTPDANMRAYVSHGGGRTVALDPRLVDTTAYPWSNIWLFGVHEIV